MNIAVKANTIKKIKDGDTSNLYAITGNKTKIGFETYLEDDNSLTIVDYSDFPSTSNNNNFIAICHYCDEIDSDSKCSHERKISAKGYFYSIRINTEFKKCIVVQCEHNTHKISHDIQKSVLIVNEE